MLNPHFKFVLCSLILLYGFNSFSNSSSTEFGVSGTVPLVLQANADRVSDLIYRVHEVSNSPAGYTVILETDAASIKYNGVLMKIEAGQIVLTQISKQEVSIDIYKNLELNSKSSFVRISIQANL